MPSYQAAVPPRTSFEPMMTLYLTDATSPEEIRRASDSGFVVGAKLYPAGATTHSDAGETAIDKAWPALEAMAEHGLVLQVHGEVTDPAVDVFDREQAFIDRVLGRVVDRVPGLKVVFEHITTRVAAQFVVKAAHEGVGMADVAGPRRVQGQAHQVAVRRERHDRVHVRGQFLGEALRAGVEGFGRQYGLSRQAAEVPRATSMKGSGKRLLQKRGTTTSFNLGTTTSRGRGRSAKRIQRQRIGSTCCATSTTPAALVRSRCS